MIGQTNAFEKKETHAYMHDEYANDDDDNNVEKRRRRRITKNQIKWSKREFQLQFIQQQQPNFQIYKQQMDKLNTLYT